MQTFLFRIMTPLLTVGCLIMIILIITNRELPTALFHDGNVQLFKLLFISIILEALPFILLGVFFSAILQVFVSDKLIQQLTPRNPIAGVIFGALLGLLFPLCECGMIPVVRRLIRKGMPAYIGIVYLLAGPVVNPIVFTSTYIAFPSAPEMALARIGLSFSVAVVIGLLLYRFMNTSPLKPTPISSVTHHHHQHAHVHHSAHKQRLLARMTSTLKHASDEFFDMGKYFIFGAFLTAVIQTAVDRDTLTSFADQPAFAYLFMMFFAFILSICSTSDAFIASSFSGIFDFGPLLAFLVFGPMIDLKNTLMLLSAFRLKIVIMLITLTAILTLAGAWLMEALL